MRQLSVRVALGMVRTALVTALFLTNSVEPRAECIVPGRWLVDQPTVELTFSGNVIGLNQVGEEGIRVTFNVDRVWKGSVPKRFDLYIWQREAEMPTFEFAKSYVVFGRPMDARSRQGVWLSDGVVAFKPVGCGAMDYVMAQQSGTLKALGEGRTPESK